MRAGAAALSSASLLVVSPVRRKLSTKASIAARPRSRAANASSARTAEDARTAQASVNATKAACQHLAMPNANDSPQTMIMVRGAGCEDITRLQPCDRASSTARQNTPKGGPDACDLRHTCSTSVPGGPGDEPPGKASAIMGSCQAGKVLVRGASGLSGRHRYARGTGASTRLN